MRFIKNSFENASNAIFLGGDCVDTSFLLVYSLKCVTTCSHAFNVK